jgi:hypothetical protein
MASSRAPHAQGRGPGFLLDAGAVAPLHAGDFGDGCRLAAMLSAVNELPGQRGSEAGREPASVPATTGRMYDAYASCLQIGA